MESQAFQQPEASIFLHPVLILFVMALGACVGSFLNVVIYRVPLGISVSKPARSFCPSCKYQIPFYHNLPILSWIFLRGKCAKCGSPIAVRYVLVEALTMLLFLVVWLRFVPEMGPAVPAVLWVLISLLIASTFIDIEHQIIPNSLNFGGTAVAVIAAALFPKLLNETTWHGGLMWSLIGAAVGYGVIWIIVTLGKMALGKVEHRFESLQPWKIHQPDEDSHAQLEVNGQVFTWEDIFSRPTDKLIIQTTDLKLNGQTREASEIVFYYNRAVIGEETIDLEKLEVVEGRTTHIVQPREAMGMGDAKFMMMIGAFLGWQAALFAILAGAVFGAIFGTLQKRLGGEKWSDPIPFGPYLAMGAFIFIFWGPSMIQWYLHRSGLA